MRIKVAKPKIAAARGRVASLIPSARSAGLLERNRFYATPEWRQLRRRVLAQHSLCLSCHRQHPSVADHVFGHDDPQALAAAAAYGLTIPATWRDRLSWLPGIVGLCHGCHVSKSGLERQGRLIEWLDANPNVLP